MLSGHSGKLFFLVVLSGWLINCSSALQKRIRNSSGNGDYHAKYRSNGGGRRCLWHDGSDYCCRDRSEGTIGGKVEQAWEKAVGNRKWKM